MIEARQAFLNGDGGIYCRNKTEVGKFFEWLKLRGIKWADGSDLGETRFDTVEDAVYGLKDGELVLYEEGDEFAEPDTHGFDTLLTFNDFTRGGFVCNCKTEKEAEDLLFRLDTCGVEWCNGFRMDETFWSKFKQDTCYLITQGCMEERILVLMNKEVAEANGFTVDSVEFFDSNKSRLFSDMEE